ncbi:hypothetical protein CVT24_007040 [Panaeolus cyanescens]|uniref:Uncharacterized protein n=1 Tax=Panaeolus cyanescens TaxID=181874 RepID=A0A409W9Y4_9AGAR|nr:hypothetical protein CVT24_007040 [Panaeolus cyanescens]
MARKRKSETNPDDLRHSKRARPEAPSSSQSTTTNTTPEPSTARDELTIFIQKNSKETLMIPGKHLPPVITFITPAKKRQHKHRIQHIFHEIDTASIPASGIIIPTSQVDNICRQGESSYSPLEKDANASKPSFCFSRKNE